MNQPLIYNQSGYASEAQHCTVWVSRGHRIRVETSTYVERGGAVVTTARTEHFHDGRWELVLPRHRIDAIKDNMSKEDIIVAHRTLLGETIWFLDDAVEPT